MIMITIITKPCSSKLAGIDPATNRLQMGIHTDWLTSRLLILARSTKAIVNCRWRPEGRKHVLSCLRMAGHDERLATN